jgi:hypothetical protein
MSSKLFCSAGPDGFSGILKKLKSCRRLGREGLAPCSRSVLDLGDAFPVLLLGEAEGIAATATAGALVLDEEAEAIAAAPAAEVLVPQDNAESINTAAEAEPLETELLVPADNEIQSLRSFRCFLNTSPFRKSKASTSSCPDNIWEKYGSRKTAAM